MDNPVRKTVYVWLVITAAAFVMIFVPGWLGIDGFSGGFAISFASIFAVIIGLIVIFVYNGLASRLDRILWGEGVLVKWSYSPELWREYTEKEFGMEKAEAKPKFILVSVIALAVGVVFYLVDPEGGLFVFGAMLALIGVIGFVAWASSRYVRGLNAGGVGDAVIARSGVFLDGRFYYWGFFGTRLDRVTLRDERGLMMLHFVTWSPSLTFGQSWDIRVPVPSGEEAKAREIESELNPKRK